MYKVRNLYSEIVVKFKELFNCCCKISIDEAIVPFKGKFAIKVLMPDKTIKFGVDIARISLYMLDKMTARLVFLTRLIELSWNWWLIFTIQTTTINWHALL